MREIKIKWIVSPKPTGMYRSFQKRAWPHADYLDGTFCASLLCETPYSARAVKIGDHPEIIVRIADHSRKPWQARILKAKAKTLAEAKAMVKEHLAKYTNYMP